MEMTSLCQNVVESRPGSSSQASSRQQSLERVAPTINEGNFENMVKARPGSSSQASSRQQSLERVAPAMDEGNFENAVKSRPGSSSQASSRQQSLERVAPAMDDGNFEEVPWSKPPSVVLYANFNQDNGCFVCGTDVGFQVFNCDPFKEVVRKEIIGGVRLVEMLYKSNVFVIMNRCQGSTFFTSNNVMIWDDLHNKYVGAVQFKSEVLAVRLKRTEVIIILQHKICVYDFGTLKLVQQIDTFVNPKGLCALNMSGDYSVLACPGLKKGEVRVEHHHSKVNMITAHDSSIACLTLTSNGEILATTSTKGTLIRTFNSSNGTCLQELRRGADKADIFGLSFSSNSQWLAVSSDAGTIHTFILDPQTDGTLQSSSILVKGLNFRNGDSVQNPSSSFRFMKGLLPKYFSSEWSFAQFSLPEKTTAIVAFMEQTSSLVVLGIDGSYYKCGFDPVHGGPMTLLEYRRFMNSET